MKVQLGSPEWIALARAYLDEHVPQLTGSVEQFGLNEVFTGPPSELDDGSGRVAWWFVIRGNTVESGTGERPDIEMRIEVPYDEVLPRARMIYDESNEAERREQWKKRRESGLAVPVVPPELGDMLTELHNYLAVRTA